eukprot:TRINITY_DN178_c0_g1_i1.p1 TRINITY_DN178_c0_g1~~TRINITY_DN178_c0_g1_i1.p1  ORF type:complete len:249 (-),score=54.71 TRINITY_DN178_c0_g1_i1:149-895(-)
MGTLELLEDTLRKVELSDEDRIEAENDQNAHVKLHKKAQVAQKEAERPISVHIAENEGTPAQVQQECVKPMGVHVVESVNTPAQATQRETTPVGVHVIENESTPAQITQREADKAIPYEVNRCKEEEKPKIVVNKSKQDIRTQRKVKQGRAGQTSLQSGGEIQGYHFEDDNQDWSQSFGKVKSVKFMGDSSKMVSLKAHYHKTGGQPPIQTEKPWKQEAKALTAERKSLQKKVHDLADFYTYKKETSI